MKVLVFTNLYPNVLNPDFGVFIRNRTLALTKRENLEIKVVAPVPYFPPLKISEKWYRFSQIPHHEIIDGIEVYHPRYLVTPKVGMPFYGYSMYAGVKNCLARIVETFHFDLIDAHFLYPDGFAACLLGRHFDCPVVLTGRGSDVTTYSQIPGVNKLVRKTLKSANHLVTVSESLRDILLANGATLDKLSVIPNGIDPDRFYLKDKEQVRAHLGVPEDKKIILTVCSLVELKGVDLLIEAISELKEQHADSFKLYVVGVGPEKERLQELIVKLDLTSSAILVGRIPNDQLVNWYNAADLFFLGSSREGWPNVVCEALACGTPVVATNVNGIPEIIDSEDLGIMVERTPEAFAQGIHRAFTRSWDREKIAERGRERTWEKVAGEVHELFHAVLKHA